MEKVLSKTFIIDGSYLLHRSLRSPSLDNLQTSSGVKTGGVFGFLRSVAFEFRRNQDYFPIVCWDEGLSKRRTSLDENYKCAKEKADRENIVVAQDDPDALFVKEYRRQRNCLIFILSYLGIPSIKLLGVEGDDIIKTLCDISNTSIILSDDKDMLQLLSENCFVRRPIRDEYWDLVSFLKAEDIDSVYKFVAKKAVLGDDSDNIPQAVKGVGKVYAGDLVKVIFDFYKDGNFDFSDFPRDCEKMKELCEKVGGKYRSAFTQLDINRFLTNMQLIDLSLVSLEKEQIESILAILRNCRNSVDYFEAIKAMSALEIHEETVSIDEMMGAVNMRKENLWIK